jgi:hypothetical protein
MNQIMQWTAVLVLGLVASACQLDEDLSTARGAVRTVQTPCQTLADACTAATSLQVKQSARDCLVACTDRTCSKKTCDAQAAALAPVLFTQCMASRDDEACPGSNNTCLVEGGQLIDRACYAEPITCGVTEVDCNGSCSNLSSDESNCGACGNSCGAGTQCTDGLCCPSSHPNTCSGVCIDLMTDAANCGGCGIACGAGATCTEGLCCPTGLTACQGVCIDTVRDANNCGACNNVCGDGQQCVDGVCN